MVKTQPTHSIIKVSTVGSRTCLSLRVLDVGLTDVYVQTHGDSGFMLLFQFVVPVTGSV